MPKNTLMFFENIIRQIFKTFILTIFYLTYSPLYLLYIVLNIVGFYSKVENSIVSYSCKTAILSLIFISVFLFVVLNIPFTKEKIERLVGSTFLETYSPGRGKTIVSLFLFLLTFSVLGCVESSSLVSRLKEYEALTNSIYRELDNIIPGEPLENVLRSIDKSLLLVRDLPSNHIPNAGILTDIANYCSVF